MPKKQKPIDEARKKLTEKLEEVKTKANKLHDIITTISNEVGTLYHHKNIYKIQTL